MPEFDPVRVLRILAKHQVDFVVVGGVAARLRGAPLLTQDIDITPSIDMANLKRLAEALQELDARLRTTPEPDGVRFPFDAGLLKSATIWTLVTSYGDLDLVVSPAGTDGYSDVITEASRIRVAVEPELFVKVASLADVIRSKEAANREKDIAALPLLRKTLKELAE